MENFRHKVLEPLDSYTRFFSVFLSVLTAKTFILIHLLKYFLILLWTYLYFFGHICITYYSTEAEIYHHLSPRAIGYIDSLLVK